MNNSNINSNILSYIFQSNFDLLYKSIKDKPFNTVIQLYLKFEILDEKWSIYDQYLKENTSILDDIIIEYKNKNCPVKNLKIYKYLAGGASYKDETIINIESDQANINLLPINFSIIDHQYCSDIDNSKLNIENYKHLFTQSFNIDITNENLKKVLSRKFIEKLDNWVITKNVIVVNSLISDLRKYNIDLKNPKMFDELEFVFEYKGNLEDLEDSLISLIQFLYLSNPKYIINFQFISFEYQYYNLQIDKKLNQFINQTKIIKSSNYINKFKIPENSIQKLMIYISDNNFLLIDQFKIDYSNFKTINSSDNYDKSEIYNFALMNVFYIPDENKFICTDLYYLDKLLNCYNYNERMKNLDLIIKNSNLIIKEYINNNDLNLINIYHFNEINKIYSVPNKFYVNLKVVKNFDDTTYLLYSSTEPISTPLMRSNIFQPQILRSLIERQIYDKKINIDNDIVKFICEFNNGWIDLRPVEIIKNKYIKADDINDVYMILLTAYYKLSNAKNDLIKVHNENKEFVTQLIFEKLNKRFFKNVLIYSSEFDINSLIRIGDAFLNFDRLIFTSNNASIVKNINCYYQNFNQCLKVISSARIIRSLNRNIYTINLKDSIYKIPSIYRKDMNLIITDFRKFNKLKDFVNIIEDLIENISSDGLIIFNYIKSFKYITIEKLLMFIFDIDIYSNNLDEINTSEINSSLFIDIERFEKNDTSKLLKIIKNNRSLIRTKSSLGNSNNSKIVMTMNDYRIYLFEKSTGINNSIYNYCKSLIKSSIESNNIEEISDPINYILTSLSNNLKYSCKFNNMSEDKFVIESISNKYDYSDYISVHIQV